MAWVKSHAIAWGILGTMKRRGFLTGSVAGSLTGALAALPAQADGPAAPDESAKGQDVGPAAANGPLLATPPMWMAPREDGFEVAFAVRRLCRAWVECKGTDGAVRRFASDAFGLVPQGDSVIRVRLSGLKPGSACELRVVVEAGDGLPAREESPWQAMRTLDPAADRCHFVVWNDTHDHEDTIQKLHEVTPQADFLLWNGDTCNDWKSEDQLVPTLLHPGGCDISAGRPLFLNWGNHDVRGKWAFKAQQLIAMPQGRPFHAFRHGPVAFIALHTGEDKPDNHPSFGGRVALEELRREQAAWLREIITRPDLRDAPHRVVFCHIPLRWKKEPASVRYETGGYDLFARGCREAWHDALVSWGAQILISGHMHEDAHVPADGDFPYAQLVSGGPLPQNARWIEGTADASGLRLLMRDLDGAVKHDLRLPRL